MLIEERCGLVVLAEGIKKKVKIPVITVGRIGPEDGDRLIRECKADFIAMACKMVADPGLPAKLAAGARKRSVHVSAAIPALARYS